MKVNEKNFPEENFFSVINKPFKTDCGKSFHSAQLQFLIVNFNLINKRVQKPRNVFSQISLKIEFDLVH